MYTKLKEALEALSRLPAKRQEEIAEVILSETKGPMKLSAAEKRAIERGQKAARDGDFATPEKIEAIKSHLRTT